MGWGWDASRRGVSGGPGMESLGTALVLLVQFWGATGLRVQQEPKWLRATSGSRVTLACQVIQSQVWERLRVEWTKDGVSLCEPHITNGSLSLEACGPRGQLSWKPPGNLTLQLDHVSLNDSGDYVCSVTEEIPNLNMKQGNGTQLLVVKEKERGAEVSNTSVQSRTVLLPGCGTPVTQAETRFPCTKNGLDSRAELKQNNNNNKNPGALKMVDPVTSIGWRVPEPDHRRSLLAPSSAWPRRLAPAPGRITLYLLPASPLTHTPRGSRGQEGSLKWEDDSKPQKRPPPTNGHVKM
ncbi:transmembrane and immunoglobulin domain-containing protein 2 isoform X4 [Lutra lutra]|uniref:transmembrane and immunoglobulin domain-containing protein 2 isoform X4 n=1 Tax=Lutra lutra TaxID=9657 RepID=UPI001FD60390|nr:transmembrane and immunoglobulin domain-containing protein 2 isoform X4 [Lutra lutra]